MSAQKETDTTPDLRPCLAVVVLRLKHKNGDLRVRLPRTWREAHELALGTARRMSVVHVLMVTADYGNFELILENEEGPDNCVAVDRSRVMSLWSTLLCRPGGWFVVFVPSNAVLKTALCQYRAYELVQSRCQTHLHDSSTRFEMLTDAE